MPDTKPKKNKIDDTARFLANTLHEIRTPIQTIVGAAELMQETNLDKEQKEYVRQILFSAEGLLELANNILDIAKVNQSGLKIENIPFDISLVAEHVVDSESVRAFNKGVELVLDISANVPALVTGDSMRVRQIMLNLISNAVKFTNEGFVHVELDYNKQDGILFTVTDSGIGISEEEIILLFFMPTQKSARKNKKNFLPNIFRPTSLLTVFLAELGWGFQFARILLML